MPGSSEFVRWLSDVRSKDVGLVGGKNASLGEMLSQLASERIAVPDGFATTARMYWHFLEANDLADRIGRRLSAFHRKKASLPETGRAIRKLFLGATFSPEARDALEGAYRDLSERCGRRNVDVAVRSSATAEDLPEASFAGQQETFLNVTGEKALLDACRRCYASLFTDRAITYRENNDFDHLKVALSIGVQRMVRSDRGGAGVMFSIDTDTGFPRVVLINAAWGLGESVVQGSVDPDEYMVFKPLLEREDLNPVVEKRVGAKEKKIVYASGGRKPTRTVRTSSRERRARVLGDEEILQLARWAAAIERHYGRPMDMEWARDGRDGKLYIVQARPETVQARRGEAALKSYRLKERGRRLLTGLSIGEAITAGPVCKLSSPSQISKFKTHSILVTGITDPDWVPIMKRAAAIVTDHGGRTSHAAIVSRELGLPAVVGTGRATRLLRNGQAVTVSCAEGEEGFVYEGELDFEEETLDLKEIPSTRTKIMLNLANPAAAFRWWRLGADGVGLARMEFIVNDMIKIHPMALVRYRKLKDRKAKKLIARLTEGHRDKQEYFVDTLAHGIGRIAAAYHPRPVIVRLSDFKTNEYARLIGGAEFEPEEENPMIGWRGASRYYSEGYKAGFALECQALKRVRDEMGLTNVVVMIPFCRTVEEADRTLEAMAEHGLKRGENGLEVYVMCEIPANVILADIFAERFDGFSIGSNDLTQLTLGVDRDSDRLAALFNESNAAVTTLIGQAIERAHRHGRKIGLCGQAPSDHPEFARFLVEAGIDTISVAPDRFVEVKRHVHAAESGDG